MGSAVTVSVHELRLRRRLLAGVRVDYTIAVQSEAAFEKAYVDVSKLAPSSSSDGATNTNAEIAAFVEELKQNTPTGGFASLQAANLSANAPVAKAPETPSGSDGATSVGVRA